MEEKELKELWALAEKAMCASSKADAKQPLQRLRFLAATLSGSLSGNASYKLSEVISAVEAASGQVRDKKHHMYRAKMHWSVFKRLVSEDKE